MPTVSFQKAINGNWSGTMNSTALNLIAASGFSGFISGEGVSPHSPTKAWNWMDKAI